MSVVITLSAEHEKETITDEQLKSLIKVIPELRLEEGLLVWPSDNDREVFFNISDNELTSDTIESEDDYALVEKISEHLKLKIYVEGEAVEEANNSIQEKQGCGSACIIISGLLVSLTYILIK